MIKLRVLRASAVKNTVIPAKAGIHTMLRPSDMAAILVPKDGMDSGFRRNDEEEVNAKKEPADSSAGSGW